MPADLVTRFSIPPVRRGVLTGTLPLLLLLVSGCGRDGHRVSAKIDFNRDVRPILNQNCTSCHGGVKAAGGVSFVFREDALRQGESGRPTIVPHHPERSELIARIVSTDPEFRMPHVDHGPPLSPEQIAKLRQWIVEGAEWSEHWAFVAPKPQTPPTIADAAWNRSPIDRFIRSRLEREKLTPASRADAATLLRRVSLDLTGLPPTPAEVAAYAADPAPDAYERQVDRLLASPRYGERWASLWLDLARYADTKGYEKDTERTAWTYRDWLINALNRNQPYDAFLIDQLAGDLLPEATLEQRIATSFHRNTQTNDEGGTDDEEFRVAAVLDRVATTWSVVNGVTFSCVQCHSHPYDPIRHEEFYRFLAFFNTSQDADYVHEYPNLRVPDDPARNAEVNALQQELERLQRAVLEPARRLVAETAWNGLPVSTVTATPAASFRLQDGEVQSTGTVSTKAVFDLTAEPPSAGSTLTALRFEVPPIDAEKARHSPEAGFIISQIDGWWIAPDGTETPLDFQRFVLDEARSPAAPYQKPVPPKVDPAKPAPVAAAEVKPAGPPPVPSTFSANPVLDRTRWMVGILRAPLTLEPGTRLRLRLSHGRAIADRPAPAKRLRLQSTGDPRWIELGGDRRLAEERARSEAILVALADVPGTYLPVMAEQPADERRETRLFVRGNWMDKGGPALEPGVPALFPPLPEGAPRNRLTLARWFFAENQPLTARAAVNRYWEQLFGLGLVETLEDYGSVGEAPSHPELLDWLARHFQFDLTWNVKALLREIVTSETYRQSARVDAARQERDPRNRLLARGPRTRLTAEMVRDQALFAAGLLSGKMAGPPVMPPQPAGVWQTVYNGRDWVASTGEDRYRRALYTFWKRTSAYPSFLTFDASTRDVCTVRRMPTNTPLQALVLMNDPVYDEAARALTRQARAEAGPEAAPRDWIARAWHRVVGRAPVGPDLDALVRLYEDALRLPAPPETSAETAALGAVGAALLNLDAALTK